MAGRTRGGFCARSCYIACVRRRGRILAIKWGMNPNSSSLGVDVTFLLVGSTVLAMVTPFIGALLRLRGRKGTVADAAAGSSDGADAPPGTGLGTGPGTGPGAGSDVPA